jgi:hypothetical protein
MSFPYHHMHALVSFGLSFLELLPFKIENIKEVGVVGEYFIRDNMLT